MAKRKSKSKSKKKLKKELIHFCRNALIMLFVAGVVFFVFKWQTKPEEVEIPEGTKPAVCELVEKNYGKAIDTTVSKTGLSPKYFKALAVLECSGRAGTVKRFERHVYRRLKDVREGKKSSYEDVSTEMLKDANDEALKNLATSWGPFQIMGYKCLHLNINVADLRGKDAVYWGIQWIEKEYGRMLKKGMYRDAFHYHNTGKTYPKNNKPQTHDPNYVQNGLKYMRCF